MGTSSLYVTQFDKMFYKMLPNYIENNMFAYDKNEFFICNPWVEPF